MCATARNVCLVSGDIAASACLLASSARSFQALRSAAIARAPRYRERNNPRHLISFQDPTRSSGTMILFPWPWGQFASRSMLNS